jgi:hypothetical protein
MNHTLDSMREERGRIVEAMRASGWTMELAQAAAILQGAIAAVEAEMADQSRIQLQPEPQHPDKEGFPVDPLERE